MRDIRRQYEHALRDIDDRIKILMADATPSRAYQAAYQRTLKKQVEDIIDGLFFAEYDAIDKYLNASYTDGYVGAMYAMSGKGVHVIAPIDLNASHKAIVTDSELSEKLYTALNRDMGTLKKVIREDITRGIATSSSYDQIARSVADKASIPLSNANRIVRTEGHRIQQASADDARNAAKAAGADVVKQWDASLDGATRKVHRELDGQIREVGEPFEDRSGKWKAMYPGKFGKPEMDCNCRCVALTRARWALDEDELKTLQERAEYFGIDKTKDFDDYRTKYLTATKRVETPGNMGEKAIPYSERGIEPDDRVKGFMKDMTKAGQYISGKAGSYKTEDIAFLTTETGVEYTVLTIGSKSYMIRGTEKGTTIPDELYEKMIKGKGTLDYHSHPYIGDVRPSTSDIKLLKALSWQEKSGIIDPRGTVFEFDIYGNSKPAGKETQREEDYYARMFGGDD